jgi:hypothetical protein
MSMTASLIQWVDKGIAPPHGNRLRLHSAIVLDEHGNATGGVRTPMSTFRSEVRRAQHGEGPDSRLKRAPIYCGTRVTKYLRPRATSRRCTRIGAYEKKVDDG